MLPRANARVCQKLLDLLDGIVDMHMEGDIESFCEVSDPFKSDRRDTIGRMRGERCMDKRMSTEALVDLSAFDEIFFPIFRPGARKIDNNQTNHSADPGLIGHFSGLIGKEIHIIETGGAPAQHLRNSMLHTVTHKRGGYPSLLGRPDVMV